MCRHTTQSIQMIVSGVGQISANVQCGPYLGFIWGENMEELTQSLVAQALDVEPIVGCVCGGSLPTSTQYSVDLRASLQTSKKTKVRSKSKKGQESLRPGSVHTWPSKSWSMEVQHGLYLCSSDRGKVEILDKRLGLHHKCPKRRLDLSQRSQFLKKLWNCLSQIKLGFMRT